MAKGKDKPVEAIEEAIVEEPKVEEPKVAEHESFVERKLKAIDNMQKPYKAKRVASRLLRKVRN